MMTWLMMLMTGKLLKQKERQIWNLGKEVEKTLDNISELYVIVIILFFLTTRKIMLSNCAYLFKNRKIYQIGREIYAYYHDYTNELNATNG